MRKLLILICLLMLSTSAWAVSPLGYTNLGVCPLGSITAGDDTLRTANNLTAFVTVGDPLVLVSSRTGKHHNAVIAAEAATYLVLAGAWTDSTDTAVKIMIPNVTLIWDAEGDIVMSVASNGDVTWYDEAGAATVFIDASASYVGLGTSSPTVPLQIGAGTRSGNDDGVSIARVIDDSGSMAGMNAHGAADHSVITRSGDMAYNSYNIDVQFDGTEDYDHYVGIQVAPVYESTGTMDNYYGLYNTLTKNAGTITNAYGLYLLNPGGSGVVTNNYGIYIANQNAGATLNYALFTDGSAPTYLGGKLKTGNGLASMFQFNSSGGVNYIQSFTEETNGSEADIAFANYGALEQWLRIKKTGAIGMGTITPGARLDLVSAAADTEKYLQRWIKSGVTVATIDSTGEFSATPSYATATYDSTAAPVTVAITGAGTYDQLTNAENNLLALIDAYGFTISADSLITATVAHKRLRAEIFLDVGDGQDVNVRFNCTAGGTIEGYEYTFTSAASDLGENVVLMGHWEPAAVGDALWIEIENATSATDAVTTKAYIDVTATGH